jgi:uncharacterized protein
MVYIFLIATTIIMLGHLGLYFTWVKLLGIRNGLHRRVLCITLGILSVSFTLTSYLISQRETALTNLLYAFAATWLGFVWYAAIATSLAWLAWLVTRLVYKGFPIAICTIVLLTAAAGYTTYGVVNAMHPVVREFTINIPNLPTAWQNTKIVQLSDIHLGPVHHQNFIQDVVAQVNAQHATAVFITGDLFDGESRNLQALAQPLQDLRSTYGTYYVTGNHETYVGVQRSLNAIRNLNLTILRDQITNVAGMQILGIDYPIGTSSKNVEPVLSKLNTALPSIVLWHEPKYIEYFKAYSVDLLLAGHTHDGQLWPFGAITKRVFHGYNDGLHVEGSFNEYTSPGIGTWGPPLRTGNRPTIAVFTLQDKKT